MVIDLVVGCIVQARMGSSRLPGKVLMKVDEETVLEYVVNQLKSCNLIQKIVVATTELPEDDKVVECTKKMNIDFFRGSEKNVLDRYYQCAKKFSLDKIVRITADNPLIDPELVDQVIQKFLSNSYDYVANFIERTFPYGTEAEIFTFNALEKAWKLAQKPSEKEHVTPFMRNNSEFSIFNLNCKKNLSEYRWTVDKKNDLELIRILTSKISIRPIKMNDILKLLSNEKDLVNINKNNIKDKEYKKLHDEDKMLN